MLVRDGAELAAAAPLMRVDRPVPSLVPLGGSISDYGDVLLDEERGPEAVAALADGLSAAARTALIDLREVRPGGPPSGSTATGADPDAGWTTRCAWNCPPCPWTN